jgi:hypothetical protein
MSIKGEKPGTFTAEVHRAIYGLMENVVELSQHAMLVEYRPPDSREFHSNVIQWAIAWEALFWTNVAASDWHEDEWIERTEEFALNKLYAVRNDCKKWPATWDSRS